MSRRVTSAPWFENIQCGKRRVPIDMHIEFYGRGILPRKYEKELEDFFQTTDKSEMINKSLKMKQIPVLCPGNVVEIVDKDSGDFVRRVAERVSDEWKLANGWSPSVILQEWYAHKVRTSKTASERNEYVEARLMVAGVTMDFVKDLAKATGNSLGSVMELLKNSKVVRFFSKIGWSFRKLWELLRNGFQGYRNLRKVMSEYLASTRVNRWTTDELKKLDQFFQTHTVTRRMTGVALGALLVFIWFNEAFIGDPEYDFDISEIADALAGRYSFADIFGGVDGATKLITLLVGSVVDFPWPGPTSAIFLVSVLSLLARRMRMRLQKA